MKSFEVAANDVWTYSSYRLHPSLWKRSMQWGLIGLLLWLSHAAAQESDKETDSDPSSTEPDSAEADENADEEIIVYGKREVDRRRRILDAELESSGYRQGKRKGDKVVYRPDGLAPQCRCSRFWLGRLKENPSSFRTLDWRTPRQQMAVLILYSTLRVDVHSCFRLVDYKKARSTLEDGSGGQPY